MSDIHNEIQNRLDRTTELLARIKEATAFDEKVTRFEELEAQHNDPDFWNQPEAERKEVITERKLVQNVVDSVRDVDQELSDVKTLYELGRDEDDSSVFEEVDTLTQALLRKTESLEITTILAGDYDANNAFLSIHAGAGGTESCDWAQMLQRMFLRWAERRKYKTEILEELPGEEAGIKSTTLRIRGQWAYGYLRSEIGVHRLVRVSPFDARGRRHTSFVSVDVSPEVDDVQVEIDESDLRIDTYRASGAGGQHVNTTDSAVRITHEPTGIVVQCQNERSQHANRNQAMRVLQSRLIKLELQKRDEKLSQMTGEKGEIAFGSQIRSYVLHPYKMAKDHRTDTETGNVDAVLDGDIDLFIEAFLRQSARAAH